MKKTMFRTRTLLLPLTAVILVLTAGQLPAQQKMRKERKDRIDRVERLKQMRLMEELQLSEEESVRFMSKRRSHEEKMMAMEEERGRILDDLALDLEDRAGDEKIGDACDRVLETDRKMFEERKRYQDEMRGLLSREKYARLLLFERDFQSQVRDAMRQSMGRKKSKFDR